MNPTDILLAFLTTIQVFQLGAVMHVSMRIAHIEGQLSQFRRRKEDENDFSPD